MGNTNKKTSGKSANTYVKKKSVPVRVFVVFIAVAMLAGIIIMPIMSHAEDNESVTVAEFETGKLSEAINEALDGTDFNFIKNIAVLEGTLGTDDYTALTNIPNLEIIELSGTETEDGIIPENALMSRNQLTYISLPKNTVEIGNNAFSGNRKLVKVSMPSSVAKIGDYAFESCESLTDIPISDSITYIGEGAFRDCKALTSFVIPNGITEIYPNTFSKCGFEQISIGPDVKKIGTGVFADCNALKDLYVYGETAPELDSDVFRNVGATVHCYADAEESFESWAQNNITVSADLTGEYAYGGSEPAEIQPSETQETEAETTAETASEETEEEETEAEETEVVTDGSADESVTTSEETAAASTAPAQSSGLSVGVVVVIVIMAVIIAVLATILIMTRKNGNKQ